MAPTLLDPAYEILAREAVFVFDIPAFREQVNALLSLVGYEISQTFNDPTTGFQAFGLTSSTKPPVLVFQPTNVFSIPDQQLDEVANADPNGVGFNQFTANKAAIASWLNSLPAGVKPDIIGASSGGALAQLFATEFIDQVGNIVTFNSPGVSSDVAAQFLAKGGAAKNVTHYVVQGDVVSLAGDAFLAGTVVYQNYPNLITIDSKTYSKIDPVFTLLKHSENRRLLTDPPPGYTQTILSTETLNDPQFNYNNDPSFAQFLAAYRALAPDIANSLTSRQTTEALRSSPEFLSLGGFVGLVVGTRQRLAPDQKNLLVGDAQDNYADGAQQRDIILGQGGDDFLKGGDGPDRINGGGGSDRLLGEAGADSLIGGQASDELVGGADSDRLTGAAPNAQHPGRGEIDRMVGGTGRDTFVLGNQRRAFYDDGIAASGRADYGLVTDFQRQNDTIELHGSRQDYVLKPAGGALPTGVGIFLNTSSRDELIGIVQGVPQLSLAAGYFRFV